MTKKKWIERALVIVAALLFSLWGTFYRYKADKELKDSELIKGKIIDIIPSRGGAAVFVEYFYKGIKFKNEFNTWQDTFKVNEIVLIKVSKKYPEKYISFLRKVKNQK